MQDFTAHLPHYDDFHDHFKKWATASLPGKAMTTIQFLIS